MTTEEICAVLKKSIVKLLVIDSRSGDVVSQGSGVIIDCNGFVLTANHVIEDFLKGASYHIIGIPHEGGPRRFYTRAFGGITFQIGDQDHISPLAVDLAILFPLERANCTPIRLEDDVPPEGSWITMAGFPEDLRTPLDIAERFKSDKVTGPKAIEKIKEFSYSIIPWVMFKHGIIGGVFHIYSGNTQADVLGSMLSFPMHAAEYWIDNTYARGASGGPVVNSDGRLIGIITETGETSTSDLTGTMSFPIPSGSTRVLSHKLITWSVPELTKHFTTQ
jgi:hypothetical protein